MATAPGPGPRIGLLGGAFAPIHCGHMALARGAHAALDLDAVHLLPTATPPHRAMPTVPFERRAHWLELAIAGEPWLRIDRRESLRPGPSYTVDTVEAWRREQPGATLFWLLGADAFAGFTGWHRWQELASLCVIAVAARPGSDAPEAAAAAVALPRIDPGQPQPGPGWCPFPVDTPDISSTEVRRRLESGLSLHGLVPEAVIHDIRPDDFRPATGA